MSNLKSNASISTGTIHRLTEIETRVNCTPWDLVESGELGEIKLALRIPEDIVVFDIDYTTLEVGKTKSGSMERRMLANQLNGYEPKERSDIKLLLLSKLDCKKFRAQRNLPFSQSIFQEALRFDANSILETIHPSRNKEPSITGLCGSPSLFGRMFATYPKSQREDVPNRAKQIDRKEIELTLDRLYVTDNDLQCFKQKHPISLKEQPPAYITKEPDKLPPDDIFKAEEYHSADLINLASTAKRFWEPKYPTLEHNKYPTNILIANWLATKYGFSPQFAAKAGATIIRPDYAAGKPDKSKQDQRMSYMTVIFGILVEASEELQRNPEFKRTKRCNKKIRNSIIDFIKAKLPDLELNSDDPKKSDHLARAGAFIINPDPNKRPRQKKSRQKNINKKRQ